MFNNMRSLEIDKNGYKIYLWCYNITNISKYTVYSKSYPERVKSLKDKYNTRKAYRL